MTIKQHNSFGRVGRLQADGGSKVHSQDMIFWTQEVTSALKSGSIAEYEKHLVGTLNVDGA